MDVSVLSTRGTSAVPGLGGELKVAEGEELEQNAALEGIHEGACLVASGDVAGVVVEGVEMRKPGRVDVESVWCKGVVGQD